MSCFLPRASSELSLIVAGDRGAAATPKFVPPTLSNLIEEAAWGVIIFKELFSSFSQPFGFKYNFFFQYCFSLFCCQKVQALFQRWDYKPVTFLCWKDKLSNKEEAFQDKTRCLKALGSKTFANFMKLSKLFYFF